MKALSALVLAFSVLGPGQLAATPGGDPPVVSVQDQQGAYAVWAQFFVAEPPDVVRAVLTDYEQIPRFMPGVRTSRVLERRPGYARIQQEAVSRFMLFSRRIHLMLDVSETPDIIQFRDRLGRSFTHYEGAWTISDRGGRTEVQYALTAAPAFEVPGFLLRRLLDRDARAMIDGLRGEIAARAGAR
jgi:ribosome-associated toxin RatA of RatAB toxin-antitoxin module